MTREEIKEAIDMIKHILEVAPKEPPTECDYVEEWLYEDSVIRKTLGMAIKALEQGLILDKVRAEIADVADSDAYTDVQQAFNDGLWEAVEIIDKHKVKNEV